ncbi:MAG: hypothetical protein UY63_C0011G0018 [Parcubacteria group bacterium GW2011_GWA2_51_10]|nr:MAG: hypothetical protein UY63_C0011G0018 [Parcubacteria group bacterium GW2011_GWA2_51_10]
MFEIAIIAESTEGGGEKFPFGTFFTSRGDPYAFTESERMLSLLLTIRLATSFCTRRTIPRVANICRDNFKFACFDFAGKCRA